MAALVMSRCVSASQGVEQASTSVPNCLPLLRLVFIWMYYSVCLFALLDFCKSSVANAGAAAAGFGRSGRGRFAPASQLGGRRRRQGVLRTTLACDTWHLGRACVRRLGCSLCALGTGEHT
eukprot:6192502-Pleurochrysis_carterae.AAC.1